MGERLSSRMSHEWHVAINRFSDERRKAGEEWPHFMYEAMSCDKTLPQKRATGGE